MSGDKSLEYMQLLKGSRKQKVLKQIEFLKPEVMIQLKAGQQCKSQIIGRTSAGLKLEPVEGQGLANGDRLILSMIVAREKILCSTHLVIKPSGWYLYEEPELYLVQRRDNFRAPLPEGLTLEACVTGWNDTVVQLQGSVLNISLGGSLLKMPKGSFGPNPPEGSLKGEFVSEDYGRIEFQAQVRRVNESEDKKDFLIGIEFEKLQARAESKIHELVMRCARESTKYISE